MSNRELKSIDLEFKEESEGKVSAVFSVFNNLDSDGDIVLHSLSDAIYGSLAEGDIGSHFPSNEENKNINSTRILNHACMLIKKANFVINNIDITIVIETPYLQPHILDMRKAIAKIMSVDITQISIKSSTSQKIGLIGEHKAVACYSTILISNEK